MSSPLPFDWIDADLAIGGAIPGPLVGRLARDHHIGAVVDVRVEARDDIDVLAAQSIEFLHLPTEDHHRLSQPMLARGVAFAAQARRAGRALLIHCQHGIGRSALLTLCVLADRGEAPLAALERVKRARPLISPSPDQYEAWAEWLRSPRSASGTAEMGPPDWQAFCAIAYAPRSAMDLDDRLRQPGTAG